MNMSKGELWMFGLRGTILTDLLPFFWYNIFHLLIRSYGLTWLDTFPLYPLQVLILKDILISFRFVRCQLR